MHFSFRWEVELEEEILVKEVKVYANNPELRFNYTKISMLDGTARVSGSYRLYDINHITWGLSNGVVPITITYEDFLQHQVTDQYWVRCGGIDGGCNPRENLEFANAKHGVRCCSEPSAEHVIGFHIPIDDGCPERHIVSTKH